MPPDVLRELELLAFYFSERGFTEKAEEIRDAVLAIREREDSARVRDQIHDGGDESGI